MDYVAEYSQEHFNQLNSAVNGLCAVNQYNQQEMNHLRLSLKSLRADFNKLCKALYEEGCLDKEPINDKSKIAFELEHEVKLGPQTIKLTNVNPSIFED